MNRPMACVAGLLSVLASPLASAVAATTIAAGYDGGVKPKTVYLGNDGLVGIRWSTWTNSRAVGIGRLAPGAASCSGSACKHPLMRLTLTDPAKRACGLDGTPIETFTYARLSSGVYFRLYSTAPGDCSWDVRGFIQHGTLG